MLAEVTKQKLAKLIAKESELEKLSHVAKYQ